MTFHKVLLRAQGANTSIRITIPKPIIDAYGYAAGDELYIDWDRTFMDSAYHGARIHNPGVEPEVVTTVPLRTMQVTEQETTKSELVEEQTWQKKKPIRGAAPRHSPTE